MKVTVLGAGSWGTTVAALLTHSNDCLLWARGGDTASEVNESHTNKRYLPGYVLPESLRATADLAEAVEHADVLFVGVPTQGFRQVIEQAAEHLRPWIPVVSLSKGFEQGSLLRMTEIIQDLLPGHPAGVMSGPNLAREIMDGAAAASVIATEDLGVARELQAIVRSRQFRVYLNHDVIGCEVGGALKNVIAIATGMAQGLSVGDNTRAAVITRGLAELTRLGVAMGGEPATFAGLAGMGDLIATCMSPYSRNRQVGEQLGRGRELADVLAGMTMVAEGVKTAVTVHELARRHDVQMPICDEIYGVVVGKITPSNAYRGLLPSGHEAEPG
ncbi:MAG TPA: NAD(P)H-dependent glycerol-3-phosphate dehydrogenase [Kineosporiaceae bacterium]